MTVARGKPLQKQRKPRARYESKSQYAYRIQATALYQDNVNDKRKQCGNYCPRNIGYTSASKDDGGQGSVEAEDSLVNIVPRLTCKMGEEACQERRGKSKQRRDRRMKKYPDKKNNAHPKLFLEDDLAYSFKAVYVS